ncbi:MAG: hypothetical protein IJR97_05315 [Clostridia bacterium]|nr:hypothetical protein [Clostridia bacterium]
MNTQKKPSHAAMPRPGRERPLPQGSFVRAAERAWPPVLACVCLLMCLLFGGMQYMTNDDYSIQNTLSGNLTGAPFPVHQFTSVFITYPIAWLYGILPSVQWWHVYSLCLVFAGLLAVHYALRHILRRAGLHCLLGPVFAVILDAAFFLYSFSNVTFTVVGGIAGLAAVMLVIAGRDADRKPGYLIAAAVLFALSVCQRRDSGIVAYCYMLVALFYAHIDLDISLLRRFLRFLGLAALFFVLLIGLIRGNQAIQARIQGPEFAAFNGARSRFMDYPKDTYGENPQLYEKLGWSEQVYRLASSWCFLPDEITAETFAAAVRESAKEARTFDMATLAERWNAAVSDERTLYTLLVCLIAAAGALIMTVLARDRGSILTEVIAFLGTAVLVFYQLYGGRANYRSLVICFLPLAVISVYLMLLSAGKAPGGKRALVIVLLTAALMVPGAIQGTYVSLIDVDREGIKKDAAAEQALYDHVIGDPDGVYIRVNTTSMKSPAPICPGEKPSNLFIWGGSSFHSACFRRQLEVNGLEELSGGTLRRDNVYLVSATDVKMLAEGKKQSKGSLALLYNWQKTEHGAVCLSPEGTAGEGLFIYRIRYEESRPADEDLEQGLYYDYTGSRFVRFTGDPSPFEGLARKPAEYLKKLGNDDFISVIAVSKDAARYLPGPVNDQMTAMGLIPLKGETDRPYIAVLDGGRVVYNEIGDRSGEIRAELEVGDIPVDVLSKAGGKYEAVIKVGGGEYNKRPKGMVVFVYSRSKNAVVDARRFDWSAVNHVTDTNYDGMDDLEKLFAAAKRDGCDMILLYDRAEAEKSGDVKRAGILKQAGFAVDQGAYLAGALLPDGTVLQVSDGEKAALEVTRDTGKYTLTAGKGGGKVDFGAIDYKWKDHAVTLMIYHRETDSVLNVKTLD